MFLFALTQNFGQDKIHINLIRLFIGNDGKDYKLVKDIANNFDDVESTLISRRIPEEGLKKNVNLVRTSWKSDHITDSELKDFIKRFLWCLFHWLNLFSHLDKA